MVHLKSEEEIDLGIKYSKNGIMNFCQKYLEFENIDNKEDIKNA